MFSRMDDQKMAASVGLGACSAEPVKRVPIGREELSSFKRAYRNWLAAPNFGQPS
jgi:hypothetical protein